MPFDTIYQKNKYTIFRSKDHNKFRKLNKIYKMKIMDWIQFSLPYFMVAGHTLPKVYLHDMHKIITDIV